MSNKYGYSNRKTDELTLLTRDCQQSGDLLKLLKLIRDYRKGQPIDTKPFINELIEYVTDTSDGYSVDYCGCNGESCKENSECTCYPDICNELCDCKCNLH